MEQIIVSEDWGGGVIEIKHHLMGMIEFGHIVTRGCVIEFRLLHGDYKNLNLIFDFYVLHLNVR